MKLDTTELNYHPHNLATAELASCYVYITDPTNVLKCTFLALNTLISGKF